VSSSQFTLRDEPSGSARRTVKNAGSIAVAAEGPRLQLQPARRLIAVEHICRAESLPLAGGVAPSSGAASGLLQVLRPPPRVVFLHRRGGLAPPIRVRRVLACGCCAREA
jgi:hypothetical protein